MQKLVLALFIFSVGAISGQTPAMNAHSANRIWIANTTVHSEPGISNTGIDVLIKDGIIEYVGYSPSDTLNCLKIDGRGRHVYAAFIHPYFSPGIELPEKVDAPGPNPESEKEVLDLWPNDAVHPERWSWEAWFPSKETVDAWMKEGIGYVVPTLTDGLIQGSFPAVSLYGPNQRPLPIKLHSAIGFSFDKGRSVQDYPSSLPGAAALLRQFIVDANYAEKHPKYIKYRRSLDAYLTLKNLPHFVQSPSAWDIPLWKQLFPNQNLVFVEHGEAYRLSSTDLKKGDRLLLSCRLPSLPEVRDPLLIEKSDVIQLKEWELFPSLPKLLNQQGIEIALNPGENPEAFRKACGIFLQNGFDEDKLLESLTTRPAEWLGLEDQIGKIEKGFRAGLIITANALGNPDGLQVEALILEGELKRTSASLNRIHLQMNPEEPTSDSLAFDFFEQEGKRWIEIEGKKYDPERESAGALIFKWGTTQQYMYFPIWQSGKTNQTIHLTFIDSAGGTSVRRFSVQHLSPIKENMDLASFPTKVSIDRYFPMHAFGYSGDDSPTQTDVVIRSATVWTGHPAATIEADVYLKKGKISAIGKELKVPAGTLEIEATGKHLTAGIIDEHSHIALRQGVNESGSAISSEVRMSDGLRPDDPAVYRQLASGVTSAQLLHGSANPIGGQSAIVRMKWGASPSEMLFPNAPGFIKFALGENVKQANWGERFTVRYPQTRLGVKTFIQEQFLRAQNPIPGPVSLRYEVLKEILAGKRNITCHSYVASEILMLMHLADSLGFKVRTFTHVLEGYKVAKELAKHGAAGSTFSDWWAYKAEVNDAIPYNAALMHKAGVLTALNSDDEAMGTRLNLEAAKMVRYGGVSEAEAWNMVTLNPAKMLGIDQRVGSIEIGKDADVVLWNGHPMLSASVPEITWIEGIDYYSKERHQRMIQRNNAEKKRLIPFILNAISKGEKPTEPAFKSFKTYHCEDLNP
jgi:imidazolonepropionase-like amidohydrolase